MTALSKQLNYASANDMQSGVGTVDHYSLGAENTAVPIPV